MTEDENISLLIGRLLEDMPEYRAQARPAPAETAARRRLLRGLMNVRPPMPLDADFLAAQDELLTSEAREKGIVTADLLPPTKEPNIRLWRGDITRLAADAVVNAANSALLGCFIPCHGCIDNAIHSAAGLQLRDECARIMRAQGREEPPGGAKLTKAYNLPAKYVLHTVGPIISGAVSDDDRRTLASCYRSCLALAEENGLKSVAFCCISTGEFRFPNREAAEIAVSAVKQYLLQNGSDIRVIFNVYKQIDYDIYKGLLG